MNNFLDENFSITGEKDASKLWSDLKYFSDHTHSIVVNPPCLHIFSVFHCKKAGLEAAVFKPDYIDLRLIAPENPSQLYFSRPNNNIGLLPYENFKKSGMADSQIEDIKNAGYFLQYVQDGQALTLVPSKALFATLCKKVGVGKLNQGIDPIRDLYLASRLRTAKPFQIVYRSNENAMKAFCCFSPRYQLEPQTVALEIKEALEHYTRVSVKDWSLNHFISKVNFLFSSCAFQYNNMQICPGVQFSLSDVGDSSYVLQSMISVKEAVILLDQTKMQRHGEEFNAQEFAQQFFYKYYSKLELFTDFLKQAQKIKVASASDPTEQLFKKLNKTAFGLKKFEQFRCGYQIHQGDGNLLDSLCNIMKIPQFIKNTSNTCVYEAVSRDVGSILYQFYRNSEH